MKKRLSIRDISREAGVSVATVSRVLNKQGYYSDEMEKRVNDVIARMNFTPNLAARALRSSVTPLVAIVFPETANLHFVQIAFGLQSRLFSERLIPFIMNGPNAGENLSDQFSDIFHAHNFCGVIYIGASFEDLSEYHSDIPTVFVECEPSKIAPGTRFAVLKSDHMQAGILGTQLLIEKGCRSILFMRNKKYISRPSSKEIGYLHALWEHQIQFNEKWIIPTDQEMGTSAYEVISELISRNFVFDAVYCNSDTAAMGVMHALTEHQIKVPAEVRVLGYTNSSESSHYFPPISTVDMHKERMIDRAAEMMLHLIQGKPLEETNILLPIEIIQRATT